MTYDFIQPFLKLQGTTIFDNSSATRKSFDFTIAETAFKKLANEVFDRGNTGSNHSVYEASGALFNLLCLENDSLRNAYFNTFMNGASKQDGFHTILNKVKDNNYLWPESTTYGKDAHEMHGPHQQTNPIPDRYRTRLYQHKPS